MRPLHTVSAGKIVLSELRSADLSRYLTRVTFVPVTPHTVRSKTRLLLYRPHVSQQANRIEGGAKRGHSVATLCEVLGSASYLNSCPNWAAQAWNRILTM
jgi:hypothetical protein